MGNGRMVDWLLVAPTHVVVDGSNIATEGRSVPSLRQLDEAVRRFQDEVPDAETIVVVDATFGHRIDPAERKAFEDAVAHGEMVSPPAGAIGRGDAFVLRIADRVHGQVLSNDSFQEFHDEHAWLFEEGRLIGGKPVPGVGWIFTPRTPVRGPRSRSRARQSAAPRSARSGATGASKPVAAATGSRRPRRSDAVLAAVEAAAAEATEAAAGGSTVVEPPVSAPPTRRRRRSRGRGGGDPEVKAAIVAAGEEVRGGPQAVNDPLTFLTFIAEHPLGDEVTGKVSNFVSHGAMVDVGQMHCYVPLSGLADPPPNSARQVLRRGETRRFIVVALDPPRRGAQLSLADVATRAPAKKAAAPTVPAKKVPVSAKKGEPSSAEKATRTRKAAAAPAHKSPAPAKKAAPAPAKKAAPTKKPAPAKKAAPTKKPAPAKKVLPAGAKKAAPAPAKKAQKSQGPKKNSATKSAQPKKKSGR